MPKYDITLIPKRLRSAKLKSGLTSDQIAKGANVDYNTVIKILNGSNANPTIKTMLGIANVFGKRIQWFIEE